MRMMPLSGIVMMMVSMIIIKVVAHFPFFFCWPTSVFLLSTLEVHHYFAWVVIW
jgi:hypothetical protein